MKLTQWTTMALAAGLGLGAQQGQQTEGALYTPAPLKGVEKLTRSALGSAALADPWPYRLASVDPGIRGTTNEDGLARLGVSRSMEIDLAGRGAWEADGSGARIWRVAVTSAGAGALRVHFEGFDAGGGRVFVYGPGGAAGPIDGPYSGRGRQDGDFWSGTVTGETLIIEYRPAEPRRDDTIPFRVNEVSHLFEDPAGRGGKIAARAAAGDSSCLLDINCHQEWVQPGSGVAMLVFRKSDGYLYGCTGTLLKTLRGNNEPYLLTANHCIATEAEAASLQALFFYQTSYCDGAAPPKGVASQVNGATLLATVDKTAGDATLLRLTGLPDKPVWFSGWSTEEPNEQERLTVVHHARSEQKRIAFGKRIPDQAVSIGGSVLLEDHYYRFGPLDGRLDNGASGAALLNEKGLVVGTNSHGPMAPSGVSVCNLPATWSRFGRFTIAYNVFRRYLDDAPKVRVRPQPESLSFRVAGGAVEPESQTVSIRNESEVAATVEIRTSAAWVDISESRLWIGALSSRSFQVRVRKESLVTGQE